MAIRSRKPFMYIQYEVKYRSGRIVHERCTPQGELTMRDALARLQRAGSVHSFKRICTPEQQGA